jgi:ABC-type lipoprotein release transport system permease subunit
MNPLVLTLLSVLGALAGLFVLITLGFIAYDVIQTTREGKLRLVTSLSIRNLMRQKRRSILLGTAIGFGMMVLVIVGGFAAGLSDLMLNKVFAMMAGHMEVAISERTTVKAAMIRDRARIAAIISNGAPDNTEIRDNLGVFSRVIGNGKADTLIVIGLPVSNVDSYEKGFLDYNIEAAPGSDLWALTNRGTCGLFEEKAKKLNVKVGDSINVRFTKIRGAYEARSYKVGCIFKDSSFFMNMTVYVDERDLKKDLGYEPWETPGLQVMLPDVNKAEAYANAMHAALRPNAAILEGNFAGRTRESFALAPIREESKSNLLSKIAFLSGDRENLSNALWISETLARETGLTVGSSATFRYQTKYVGMRDLPLTVGGIFQPKDALPGRIALYGGDLHYKYYYDGIPLENQKKAAELQATNHPLAEAFVPEWNLLPRTKTFDAQRAKLTRLSSTKWKGQAVDVRTLKESESFVLKLEQVLNTIAYSGVLIMFFIIVIGVINALRMTIRERTREIGTVRSMGMDRREVRLLFLFETVSLSFFACLAGLVLGLILMALAGLIHIPSSGIFSMLLDNGHLHFMVRPSNVLVNFSLILAITAMTAFFPARKAANLHPAEALRHTAS